MRFLVLALAGLCIAPGALAQQDLKIGHGEADVGTFVVPSSPGDDWINDIVELSDGGLLAVGFLNRVDGETPSDWRALAAKYAADGEVRWSREIGEGGGLDAFWTAREGSDGAVALAGFTSRIGPGGINAYAAVLSADGETLKENGYGTPGYDRITGLAPAAEGFIAAGHAEGLDGRDVMLLGLDPFGAERWRRIFEEGGSNGALYVEPAEDGNFIVTGGTSADGDADMLVMKVDSSGRELWRTLVGEKGTDDINHGLAVLENGRIVIAGYTRSWGAQDRDIVAASLSSDGKVLAVWRLGGAGDDRPTFARAGLNGEVWIVGRTSSAGAGGVDAVVARVMPDGALDKGVLLFGGITEDFGTAIRPLKNGDLLVAGYSMPNSTAHSDAFLVRLALPRLAPHPSFSAVRVTR